MTSEVKFITACETMDSSPNDLSSLEEGDAPRGKIEYLQKTISSLNALNWFDTHCSKYIIYPQNKWIKRWDLMIVGLLFLYLFVLPYQIGVSSGYYLLQSKFWLALNISFNCIFFVDNFLYFIRAYRNKDGRLVMSLPVIRRNYVRSFCVPNFLSTFPSTILFYGLSPKVTHSVRETFIGNAVWALVINLLKFLRFAYLPTILKSSDAIADIRGRNSSRSLQLFHYVLLLMIVSHWFACIWCLVAFIEAGSTFAEPEILTRPNWISLWYNNTFQEGGLNPIGREQSADRYILSLFWAVQTLTSIGYGNVMPLTATEWWISTTAMLLAGILWAYVIGGLVSVVAGMNQRLDKYGERLDEANQLIRAIPEPDNSESDEEDDPRYRFEKRAVSKSIKRYVHNQFHRSRHEKCAYSIFESYPILETLTPELQQNGSLLVMKKYLEAVPYLSSQYLTRKEQAAVALQCSFIDFSTGETVQPCVGVGNLGSGVVILDSGLALSNGGLSESKRYPMNLVTVGNTFGASEILLEEKFVRGRKSTLRFLTFSRVVFIPRKAIFDVLNTNQVAWRACARWKYLRCLILSEGDRRLKLSKSKMINSTTSVESI